MSELTTICINVASSFIFIFILLILFKPKLIISPFVCKYTYVDGKEYFFIKMINISCFSAHDIKIELLEVDRYSAANGQMNQRFRPLSVVLDHVSHIPGYRPSWLRKNAPYAIIFRTSEDINSILTNDYKAIMIKVSLRHGLTGLVKVATKEYTDETQIKNGKFKYGLKFGSIN